ncbi:hypothetical protein SESBI_16287 [Sesbania bispinosa]|nr:hypothetical protein SESBI_16287 [Sesbania bispinosa]
MDLGNHMKELNQKKVEALRDKWAATIMMHNEEYTGARQKLLNAQKLYPELDQISLMLTIRDILLLASSVRLSYNEIDFLCILDLINPSATYSDAKCYLHNLVTSINGVKYEFPGAELALEVDVSYPDVEQSNWEKSIEVDHISLYHLLFSQKIPTERLMSVKDEVLYELDQMALPKNLIQHIGNRNPIKDSSNCGENKLCVGEFQLDGKFLKYNNISAADFAPGQVWAIYCGKDVMPRQYVLVNSMVSNNQICVTILEAELVLKDENKWREDLPIVCGTLKQGNSNVILSMSQFSHLVKHVQGTTRPHYMIYPQKGEIWAMYKNWNRKWEVLAYRVPGIERYGIPEDSWHLEPHAIPHQHKV